MIGSFKSSSLWISTMGFFAGFAGLAALMPLIPHIGHSLHLSPFAVVLLAASANLSGSLLRIPFGGWADVSGPRKPFLVLLSLSWIGLTILGILLWTHNIARSPESYGLLFLAAILIGAGVATFPVGIVQTSLESASHQQGRNLGIYAALGNLGPGLFSLLLPLLILDLGRSGTYALWIVMLALIIAAYAWLAPAHTPSIRHQSWREPLKNAARYKTTWRLTMLYFMSFGGFLALLAWLPQYWHHNYHLSLVTAGSINLLFTLLASLTRIAGGWLQDRQSATLLVPINLVIIMAGSVFMATSHSLGLSLAGLGILTIGLGLQNGSTFKLVAMWLPQVIGGASGWVGGIGALGGFVLPPIMALIGHGYGSISFIVFSVFAVVNGLILVPKRNLPQSTIVGE